MKILHTADLHLREHEDERWEALRAVVQLGVEEGADALVISGDLFDRGINAEDLKHHVRALFSGTGMKVLILPGNHDADSYKGGVYFGEDVEVLGDVRRRVELEGVRIYGLPFQRMSPEEVLDLLRSLSQQMDDEATNVLLYHGELLDAFFSAKDFGGEGEVRYMPAGLSYFEQLPLDYVLAGHFHTKFDVWELKNGGYFVYPGSPVSITRKETGRRMANLFQIGEPPDQRALDTSHFEQLDVTLDPFRGDDPVAVVRESLSSLHPQARTMLTVSGFLSSEKMGMTETELAEQVRELAGPRAIDIRCEFRDISDIVEDELFKSFSRRLAEMVQDEDRRRKMRDLAIRAMMEAAS